MHLRIRPGDVISAVNGIRDLVSIIALCQLPGTFTFEVNRGPFEARPIVQPDFSDQLGAETHNFQLKVESEVEQQRDREQLQQSWQVHRQQTLTPHMVR